MLGHCSVVVTGRYAHPKPDSFSDRDRGIIVIDLSRPDDEVVQMQPVAARNDRLGLEQPQAAATIT